jgi:asparagine synthase (glutamine-hydrolysing)
MCGIVGTYGIGDQRTIERMLSITTHRGEDNTCFKIWGDRCGLGINRLSIVDLYKGDQPLHNESRDVFVVCNGEIYNHRSIASELQENHTLRTDSDVEVVSHLYEEYGDDCVNLLDGMFAFVVYDARRNTFLAARDPLGIKPFYYAREDRCWYFASEAKALVEAGVEPQAVRALPPGFRLTPERGPEQYYYLATHRSVPNPALLSSLVDHAVVKRLMADREVEVGTFLSGGLDSSIVTALAARHNPDLQAVTVGMEGAPDVEAAKQVAAHLGIRHHIRTFTVEEMAERLPEAIWHVESYNPSMVTGALVTFLGAELAKEHGIKVVLCGEGADEIFAGYLAVRHLSFPDLHEALWTLVNNLHKTELQRLDRMSMAVSLEARVPFMDRDVVEYALNLPPTAKIREHNGRRTEKWVLRQAFSDGLLPEEIVWREKMPFDQGSGGRGLIGYVEDRISDDELAAAQLRWPDAQLVSKEMLHYYRIWREHFGEMGGKRSFDLFGDYPVMFDRIAERTAESGS